MIGFKNKGSFKNTRDFINSMLNGDIFEDFDQYGERGVEALASATPVDTGLSARSWGYRIIKEAGNPGIEWYNTNTVNGTPVVILLQYGHATGTGGYVEGRDFINPAIRPIFEEIADEMWKKVKS